MPKPRDNPAAVLMLQGTGSDVGKSLIVAGLCRLFSNRGLRVHPFKPQNMSNNAAVTMDGGEIGRAQALQAMAAHVAPTRHMNPVLLKPETDLGAQVVVQGHVLTRARARDYYQLKSSLMTKVLESFHHVQDGADLVIVEGAGSPAEANLRPADIANMGFAEAVDCPVVIVADIDRGGVLASLVGTHQLLSGSEQDRIKGYIINKFRGDASLFDSAVEIIRARTDWPSLGVVPFFPEVGKLPAEDAMSFAGTNLHECIGPEEIKIIVPRLPRIANFDDLDPLMAEHSAHVAVIDSGNPLPMDGDVILLPGSKATLADLDAVRAEGWDIDILAHHRRGGKVVGICGGYQMLGNKISDPDGVEGPARSMNGLGLLDVETVLGGDKTLNRTTGTDVRSGHPVEGYEIHMGTTTGPDCKRPWLMLDGDRDEGARSKNGQVMGCYLHGLFMADDFRSQFLENPGRTDNTRINYRQQVEQTLDDWAGHLEKHLDIKAIEKIAFSRN